MFGDVGDEVNERFDTEEKYQSELIANECSDNNDNVHRNDARIWSKHDDPNIGSRFFIHFPRVHIGKEMIAEKYPATNEHINDIHRIITAEKGN